MPQYDYRLVKTTYRNSIEQEDGPGSLTNVLAERENESVLKSWLVQDENFGKQLLEGGFRDLHLPDSAQGEWIDYSYQLERRLKQDNAQWEFVDCVHQSKKDQQKSDDEWRWGYLMEDDGE